MGTSIQANQQQALTLLRALKDIKNPETVGMTGDGRIVSKAQFTQQRQTTGSQNFAHCEKNLRTSVGKITGRKVPDKAAMRAEKVKNALITYICNNKQSELQKETLTQELQTLHKHGSEHLEEKDSKLLKAALVAESLMPEGQRTLTGRLAKSQQNGVENLNLDMKDLRNIIATAALG